MTTTEPDLIHQNNAELGVPIRGRGLRFVIVAELMRRSQMTVSEMISMLAERGHVIDGRASKVISDSLRWEVRRNRVTRVRRGLYAYRGAPPTTARRIRIFAEFCKAWIVATRRGQQPPPVPPPDPRSTSFEYLQDPYRAPWRYFGWLWTCDKYQARADDRELSSLQLRYHP